MLIPTVSFNDSLEPCSGHLRYEDNDYSFSFDYTRGVLQTNQAWLCFGVIEVAVSCINGQLLGVSGYTGRRTWINTALTPEHPFQFRSLIVEEFVQLQVGVGFTVSGNGFDTVKYNQSSGWAHVGDGVAAFDTIVEFASNCCAAISGCRVVSIWLRPENWCDLV